MPEETTRSKLAVVEGVDGVLGADEPPCWAAKCAEEEEEDGAADAVGG